MPEPSLISAYLTDLDGALRLSRRQRARVMAESEDHLLDRARHALAADADPIEAQRVAIERFGPVPVVAAAFHRQAASATVRSSLVRLTAAVGLSVVAQAIGSPLFWHIAAGGLRPAGPWPSWVKDGIVLAADLRAVADVVAILSLMLASAGWARGGRRAAGPSWLSALAGLATAGALGIGALAGLAELMGATGFGPTGGRAAAIGVLLVGTGALSAGTVLWAASRLWAVRTGWLRPVFAGLSPRVQGALRRAVLVAVPAGLVVTVVAGLIEVNGQGNLRGGADNPQIQVARQSARLLAVGVDPTSIAKGPKVDLATSLGVHVTVFDRSGRVLSSTAVLAGRTPVPPRGVLSTASHRDDLVTWQPRPDVRVAAVATRWSGPAGQGTIVVGRSLRVVEQRESRLLRRIAAWWLLAMLMTAMAALIAAFWPRPPAAGRARGARRPGVAPA